MYPPTGKRRIEGTLIVSCLEDLDCGCTIRGRGKLLVSGDQNGLQLLGERYICRIVCAQVLSEPPNLSTCGQELA